MPKIELDAKSKEKKDSAVKEMRIQNYRNKGMSERDATIAGLVDMKRKDDESEVPQPVSTKQSEGPKYPYGLRFRLEDEDLQKLGFSDLPKIGDTCKFSLEATPESVSQNQNSDGKEHKCVEFQITDMKWDGEGSKKESDEGAMPEDSDEDKEKY